MNKPIRSILVFLLALLCCGSARAQFLGYIANQGVNQNVWTNASCSSTLTSSPLQNIGQVGHALYYTVTNPGPNLIVQIQGGPDGTTYFQISNNAPVQPGIIAATGSYPFLRAQVTGGGAGCTITANYSGSSVATTVNLTGSNAQFMYLFNPFINQAAGTTASSGNIAPPYGNAAGYVLVSYLGGAGPGGSTIAVKSIDGPTGTTNTIATFSLATTAATAQVFPVQGYSSNSIFLTYTAGGASANTFTVSYYFTYPGQGPSAAGAPTNVNIVSPNPLPVTFSAATADPCQNSGAAKSSASINISSATTTQIVALSSGKQIFVCGISITEAANGTNTSYQWEYGTTASCGSGVTALSGTYEAINSQTTSQNLAGATLLTTPASDALCILTAGTFTSPGNVAGFITYVQQ